MTPLCGCRISNGDAGADCLYPEAVAQHEKTVKQLIEAIALLERLVVDASWRTGPVAAASEWLEKTEVEA